MDEGIPYTPASRTMVDYIRWALPKGAKSKEQEAREYLLSLGYRLQSPAEREADLAHWREVVEGIDQ